jgi:hypothetical protein
MVRSHDGEDARADAPPPLRQSPTGIARGHWQGDAKGVGGGGRGCVDKGAEWMRREAGGDGEGKGDHSAVPSPFSTSASLSIRPISVELFEFWIVFIEASL